MVSASAKPIVRCLLLAVAVSLAACSRSKTPPQLLVDVPAPPGMRAALNLYVPGSILDSWVALDIEAAGQAWAAASITYCDHAAARVADGVAELVLFSGASLVRAPEHGGSNPFTQSMAVTVKIFDRKPSLTDLKSLVAEGFAVTECRL